MKKYLFSVLALFSLTVVPVFAGVNSAKTLLIEMNTASQHLDYEVSYILVKKGGIEPLMYRHAYSEKGGQLAHLVYLSGPMREVIRRGNEVSYIDPGIEPFTIESGTMVGPTIPFLNTNVDHLSNFYDFIQVGRAREAGATCQVLRIVPKDGQRYSYVLWVDEKTKLPLRADLVDRDGETLEQYRTISYDISKKVEETLNVLKTAALPEVLSLPKGQLKKTHWAVGWIPVGFEAKEVSRYRMNNSDRMVESQLYSDGLFSFSVYVADADSLSLKGQLIRQGRRTLHSFVRAGREISVIGDIPPATAERIAKSIKVTSSESVVQ
ncbi:sigma-E factor regulatory protein RseB [Vibrio caribbeanicus]|uniref:Periplasmic negative regulator of sigmaE n=1 Tax=Vibrio caribbeanicus ATCC BAA-2122 TaxID=796620 RepID=E3BFT0_9VIBR|nr:sigma-E factor regulatory protein RseB [Vibrio caribbeanicus]EFP98087.1 periplasmic negative regulator of sigmaE [Vibrio caribbeanicus ATCC BAA-2122]